MRDGRIIEVDLQIDDYLLARAGLKDLQALPRVKGGVLEKMIKGKAIFLLHFAGSPRQLAQDLASVPIQGRTVQSVAVVGGLVEGVLGPCCPPTASP